MLAMFALLVSLSGVRLDGRDVCLDSAEARRAVSYLEDRLLLLESDSLGRLRHSHDSAALAAADTAISRTSQALEICKQALQISDSARQANLQRITAPKASLRKSATWFGAGFSTATALILLWVLR